MKYENISQDAQFHITGLDLYDDFIEKSIVNYQKYKRHFEFLNRI